MSKIYLPTEYVNSPCKVINNGYIRAYTNSSLTEYVDIYLNQDYMLKQGTYSYGYSGQCDTINSYTNNFYYRTDFPDILLMFSIFVLFGIYLPFRIIRRFYKKWKI